MPPQHSQVALPGPSPQGTPEALPSPILRAACPGRALPRSTGLRAAPTGCRSARRVRQAPRARRGRRRGPLGGAREGPAQKGLLFFLSVHDIPGHTRGAFPAAPALHRQARLRARSGGWRYHPPASEGWPALCHPGGRRRCGWQRAHWHSFAGYPCAPGHVHRLERIFPPDPKR